MEEQSGLLDEREKSERKECKRTTPLVSGNIMFSQELVAQRSNKLSTESQ